MENAALLNDLDQFKFYHKDNTQKILDLQDQLNSLGPNGQTDLPQSSKNELKEQKAPKEDINEHRVIYDLFESQLNEEQRKTLKVQKELAEYQILYEQSRLQIQELEDKIHEMMTNREQRQTIQNLESLKEMAEYKILYEQ